MAGFVVLVRVRQVSDDGFDGGEPVFVVEVELGVFFDRVEPAGDLGVVELVVAHVADRLCFWVLLEQLCNVAGVGELRMRWEYVVEWLFG